MSCIRRIISDIDGRSSTTQNSANNAIIIILNTFTVVGRQVRLIIRSIKSATIITELARTPPPEFGTGSAPFKVESPCPEQFESFV